MLRHAREAGGEDADLGPVLEPVLAQPPLEQDEMRRLFVRLAEGDERARETLVARNMRLVVSVARRYRNQGVPLEDLVQAGAIGLDRAVRGFDLTRGTRFSTYASYWVAQAVERALLELGGTIRVPVDVAADRRKVEAAAQVLEGLGIEGSDAAIAERVNGVDADRVRLLRSLPRASTFLDAPLRSGEEAGATHGEMLAAPGPGIEERVADELEARGVRSLVATLPEQQARVIELRFGLDGEKGLSLAETGKSLGLSPAKICRIERAALSRLRPMLEQSERAA